MTEEIANTVSHGLGALLGAAALVVLVVLASLGGDPWRIVSVSVYGGCLLALFSASTAYHAVQRPGLKAWLRVADHACIYLLIAGTYTPFTLVPLRGPWGFSLFGVVWGLALLGVAAKLCWTGRFEVLSVSLYLIMGWLGVIAAGPLIEALSREGLAALIAGGLAYSGGVIFYGWTALPFHHLWWHLAVLLGAALHFFAVLTLVW